MKLNRLKLDDDPEPEPTPGEHSLPNRIISLLDAEIANYPNCTFSHLIGSLEQAKAQVIVQWRRDANIQEE